jgi:thioredoxin 1
MYGSKHLKEDTMKIPNIRHSEFKTQVLQSPNPVLVAFRASSCLPSQRLAPIIDEIAGKFGERVRFVAVDAEGEGASISRRFKVTRLPVTMLFDQGRGVDFVGGMASRDTLVEMIERRLKRVHQVDELNFDADVLEPRIPVIVHFDAAWCSVSRALVPVLDKLAEKFHRNARFVRVEFGPANARLCSRFGVSRVPTLSLFVDGHVEDQIFGGMSGEGKKGGLASAESIEKMLTPFLL